MIRVLLANLRRGLSRRLTTVLFVTLALILTAVVAGAEELETGDRGSAVKNLQQELTDLGYDVGLVDGVYGRRTRDAVRQFQLDNGLTPTGKVDEQTWQAVFAGGVPAADDEDEDDEDVSLDDEFDFSEWGLESGGTSLEVGGYLQSGFGSKFQDSDIRFPDIIYLDQFNHGVWALEATDKTSYQNNNMQLWFKGGFGGDLSAYAAFDLAYFTGPERPFSKDLDAEIDEAYVTYSGEEISWTLGKEKINWGVMDLISPFNILNSANMLDPFVNTGLHDQRGQWGLHFNWDKVGSHRLEAVFVPVWNRSVVPMCVTWPEDEQGIKSDYWLPPVFASMPAFVWLADAVQLEDGTVTDLIYQNDFDGLKKPPKDLSTFSLGTRYLVTTGDYDLGLYFITTKDPKPTVAIDVQYGIGVYDFGGTIGQRQGNFLYTRVVQDFSRVYAGGISIETVKGKFRLKQETAITYGRRFFPDITSAAGMQALYQRVEANQGDFDDDYTEVGDRYAGLNLLFGSEYTIPGADIITSLQLAYRHRFGYEEIYFGNADYFDITFYAQKSFADDQFTASMSSMIQAVGGSAYLTPRLRYVPAFAQSLELGLGFNFFFGESEEVTDDYSTYTSILGSYQKYSNVFLTGKYLFGFDL